MDLSVLRSQLRDSGYSKADTKEVIAVMKGKGKGKKGKGKDAGKGGDYDAKGKTKGKMKGKKGKGADQQWQSDGAMADSRVCRKCRQKGHIARDCTAVVVVQQEHQLQAEPAGAPASLSLGDVVSLLRMASSGQASGGQSAPSTTTVPATVRTLYAPSAASASGSVAAPMPAAPVTPAGATAGVQ